MKAKRFNEFMENIDHELTPKQKIELVKQIYDGGTIDDMLKIEKYVINSIKNSTDILTKESGYFVKVSCNLILKSFKELKI